MKKTLALLAGALIALQTVNAEESALSTTVSAAYNSKYILYGYDNGDDLYHGDVYLSYSLTESVSLWGGSWYGQIGDGSYEEVDVYGGVDYYFTGHCSAGVAYAMFNYIETPFATNDIESEFAVHASYATDVFSLSIRNQYDTGAEGNLTRIIGGATQPINDTLSLTATLEAGYAFEYYITGNRWNHALGELSLPLQLTPALNITPSVTYSIPLAATEDLSDEETVGAVSVAYSF